MKFLKMATLATAIALVAGCGGISQQAAGSNRTYHFRIGSIEPEGTSQLDAVKAWASAVNKDTGGKVQIEIFPNSQLGTEEAMLAAVTSGSLDGELVATAILEQQVPRISVLDLPYVFKSPSVEEKLLQGPLSDKFASLMLDKHIKLLAWTTLGTRDILSKKPIQSLADMKGVKIRVPAAPVYVGAFKALGADPAPIAYNEVYTSLQSGVVQAVEVAPEQLYTAKFYEVAKNLTITNHITIAQAMVMNDKAFASLPDNYRQIVTKDAMSAAAKQWTEEDSANQTAIDKMKAAGVQVYQIDQAQWSAQTQAFNKQWADSVGGTDIYQQIVKANG